MIPWQDSSGFSCIVSEQVVATNTHVHTGEEGGKRPRPSPCCLGGSSCGSYLQGPLLSPCSLL